MGKRALARVKGNNQGAINVGCPVGFLNGVGGEHLDPAPVELLHAILRFWKSIARVNNRGDLEASIEQLAGKRQTCLIMGDNHCACTRLHSIQMQQPPRAAAQHDTGEIVILKNGWILVAPGRNNHAFGAEMDQPLGLHHAQQPAFIAAKDRRGRQNINVRLCCDFLT